MRSAPLLQRPGRFLGEPHGLPVPRKGVVHNICGVEPLSLERDVPPAQHIGKYLVELLIRRARS